MRVANSPILPSVGPLGRAPSFGILSSYPPTPCGLATFTAALADGLSANGAEVSVVRVADDSTCSADRVIGELVNGSPASVAASAELLNQYDVAVIQHEYGIFGGVDGDEVLDILEGLRVPSIVIAHTILSNPTPHQRSVLVAAAALAHGPGALGIEHFPNQIADLIGYLEHTIPSEHPFSRIQLSPDGETLPEIWILGSSGQSAKRKSIPTPP